MKLKEIDSSGDLPDLETLQHMVRDYREFSGTRAAFHIEHFWWPGQFETKEEEIDFHLNEYGRPYKYEVIDRWHEEAVQKLAVCEIDAMDIRSSRNVWRVVAIVLLIPYLALWYLWKTRF